MFFLIFLGFLIGYAFAGSLSVIYPNGPTTNSYTSATRFFFWPGVAFPKSPFGAILRQTMDQYK